MSPIEGLSDKRWYPRLGIIRLGIKAEGQKGTYPKALDYFVCPKEVQEVYKEKPKELDVMFPSEKLELIAPQYYKCYSYSQGKICQGTGRTCRRKIDIDTGDFVDRNSKKFTYADGLCDPEHCQKIGDKQCRRVMSLIFLLPSVPGLGVYQLNTSSYYSIRNINSQLSDDPNNPGFLRLFTRGRISGIPLKLSLVEQEVNPPGEGRKTVHVLNIRADVKLADIIALSRKSMAQILLPPIDDEEPPDDLFPDDVLQAGELQAPDTPPPSAAPPEASKQVTGPVSGGPAAVDPDWNKMVVETDTARAKQEAESAEVHNILSEDLVHDFLRKHKWTYETFFTWLHSFQLCKDINTNGTLEEVLNRFNTEQAKFVVRELELRDNNNQSTMFS